MLERCTVLARPAAAHAGLHTQGCREAAPCRQACMHAHPLPTRSRSNTHLLLERGLCAQPPPNLLVDGGRVRVALALLRARLLGNACEGGGVRVGMHAGVFRHTRTCTHALHGASMRACACAAAKPARLPSTRTCTPQPAPPLTLNPPETSHAAFFAGTSAKLPAKEKPGLKSAMAPTEGCTSELAATHSRRRTTAMPCITRVHTPANSRQKRLRRRPN